MKTIFYSETLLAFSSLFFITTLNAQYPNWKNFNNAGQISAIAFEGSTIWTVSDFGMCSTDTVTGTQHFYNKTNSSLASNFCPDIEIDQFNNKWIATSKGISVFDGTSWTNYNSSNTPLLSDSINDIAINGNTLWFATANGLAKYDGTTWTVYTTSNSGLSNNNISKIDFDSSNLLWIASSDTSIYLNSFDGATWQGTNYYYGLPLKITGLAISSSNGIYISINKVNSNYNHGFILQFNSAWSMVPINYPNDCGGITAQRYVTAIAMDAQQNLWFGNSTYKAHFVGPGTCIQWGVVGKYDGTNTTIYFNYMNPPNNAIERSVGAIAFDANANCWIGNSNGILAKFDSINSQKTYTSNSALLTNRIFNLNIDKSSNKWININSDYYVAVELYKFDNTNWQKKTDLDTCLNNMIYYLTTDSNHISYFSRNGIAPIKSYDGNSCSIIGNGIASKGIVDSTNALWTYSFNGLAKYNGTWTYFNSTNGTLPKDNVACVFFDSNNNTWVGMQGYPSTVYGLAKYNGSNWTYYGSPDIPDNNVLCGVQDLNGNIWVGTEAGGLAKFDGITWVVYNTSNSPLPSNEIMALAVDLNGDLWIGTGNYGYFNTGIYGLVKYDGTNWQLFNTDNSGLFDNEISDIDIDQWGNKWISTWKGGIAVYRQGGVLLTTDNHNTAANNISVYPNPFHDKINIDLPYNKHSKIYLTDMSGKIIEANVQSNNENQIQLNTQSLSAGCYILKIINSKEVLIKKLVKY